MEVNVKELENSQVELEITVPAAELDEKIQSIADVQKSMRVGICFNIRQDILRIKFYAVNAIVFYAF